MVYFIVGTLWSFIMSKVPFGRFITTFLLFSKNISFIVNKLNDFGYQIPEEGISEIFKDLKGILPEKFKKLIEQREMFNVKDPGHVQWLKQLDVFEFYDFVVRKDENLDDPPPYFKWCEDCMWIHGYKDVMVLVNILIFNGEENEDISKIIMYKYRKKIGIEALDLYRRVFWNTECLTAKEALYYCLPFQNNALIIRRLRSGNEAEKLDSGNEQSDGSDVPFTFHDTSYIKWKIGYRDVEVPTSRDFLEGVKKDSYFKYYEAMNMTHSIEIEEEEGLSVKLGAYNETKTKKRNVEEQRVKMAKQWLDIFIKAEHSIPVGSDKKEDFFERMEQLELGFDEEKIARIDDMPEVMDDIKQDINPI